MFATFRPAAFRALAFVGALLVTSSTATPAHAQDPRKAQATPVFEEGLRLADKNKHAEALEKFRKAYALYPSPNTLFNVARSEHILGMTLDALRDYREALRNPMLSPPLSQQAKGFVGELEKTVGRVQLTGPSGTTVTLAGTSYTLPMAEPVDVLPGAVTAKVESEGGPRDVSVQAVAGTVATLDVTPPADTQGATRGPTEPPLVEPPRESHEPGFWTTQRKVGATLWGLAVVGAAVGTGFVVAREGHVSDGEAILGRTPTPCANPADPVCGEILAERDGAKSTLVGAAVSYSVAGALLVGGAVAWWWPSRSAEKSSVARASEVRVRVVPSTHGVWLTGTF